MAIIGTNTEYITANVKQIFADVNSALSQTLGENAIINEDYSNIVDIGKQLSEGGSPFVAQFFNALAARVNEFIIVNRYYDGIWKHYFWTPPEFGQIRVKLWVDIPDAEEDNAFRLADGNVYNGDLIYHAPSIDSRYYNSKNVWRITISRTFEQLVGMFANRGEMEQFYNALANSAIQGFNLRVDRELSFAVNNFIVSKINAANGVVDLLALYNEKFGKTLTAEQSITDKEFLTYAIATINLYKGFMQKPSRLFNVTKAVRQTSENEMIASFVGSFAEYVNAFVRKDLYNSEMLKLPKYSDIPYWQGISTADGALTVENSFDPLSCMTIKGTRDGKTVTAVVAGIITDIRAIAGTASNVDVRNGSYNGDGDFQNQYFRRQSQIINDLDENGIIFTLGAPSITDATPSA